MVNTRGWRLLGAGVCVAALAIAGCGNDGDSTGNGAESESQGPLAEFFGWDEQAEGGEYEASEEERQQHYEIEEYVVTCMAEAGFEYFPQPFWGDQEDRRGPGDDPWEEAWQLRQDDPEAFARQYGYGATTIEYEEEPEPEATDPSDDPNWEYQESLSEAARAEYEKALWGDWEAVEDEGGEATDYDPSEVGGCYNEAHAEVYGSGEDESQFEDLWEKMDDLHKRIEEDSRMTTAIRTWSDCMAEKGYPDLEDLYGGENLVYEKQSELYGWDEGEVEIEEGEATAEAVDPDFSPAPPVEPDPEQVAELRQFELDIAWADFECKRDHDIEKIQREVQFEYEERFIEENRAELEAYRDWQNEQGFGGGVG